MNQQQSAKEQADPQKQAQNWAMLCHLSALVAFIGVPFGHILGPLVVWLLKKDEFPLVNEQGKEALNFQISMSIYSIIALVLIFVLVGVLLLIGLALVDLIFVIIASVKTSKGQQYRYPLTIRFIK